MSKHRSSLDRRTLLRWGVGAAVGASTLASAADSTKTNPQKEKRPVTSQPRMPVLFLGHGSPMNAIEDNQWSRAFIALGAQLPKPKAILAVSAHWLTPGTFVTSNERPETIHDFGGFPRPLFEVQYPARGDVALAKRIAQRVAEGRPALKDDWGLDHGTWSVLRHLRPEADVPVLQLSIDPRLSGAAHVALGKALAPLREEGVMIVGSGNITHNLRHWAMSMRSGSGPVLEPWAEAFDRDVATAVEQRDVKFLEGAPETDNGRDSHPSSDHYLPLLYVMGAVDAKDRVSYPVQGFDGSLSMRSIQFS